MKFYELTYPDYESDAITQKHNPVRIYHEYVLPGINCQNCGAMWSGSQWIPLNFDANAIRECYYKNRMPYILDNEWYANVDAWSNKLSLEKNKITPGLHVGMPVIELKCEDHDDFMRYIGYFIIKEKVVEFLKDLGVTGVEFLPFNPIVNKKLRRDIELWILKIDGHAWRVGATQDSITVCDSCGRTKPANVLWVVDEDRWDGSDFFHIDMNPNKIFVTERVRNAIVEAEFTNCSFETLLVDEDG